MGRRSRAEALGTRKDDLDSEASRLGDHDLLPLVRSSRGGGMWRDGVASDHLGGGWKLSQHLVHVHVFFKKRGRDRELVSAVSRDQTR